MNVADGVNFTIAPRYDARVRGNEISERGSAEARNKGRGIAEYMLNLPGCGRSVGSCTDRSRASHDA